MLLVYGLVFLCNLGQGRAAEAFDDGQEVILIIRRPLVHPPLDDGKDRFFELAEELQRLELKEKLFPQKNREGMEWPLSVVLSGSLSQIEVHLWFHQKEAPHRRRTADIVERYCSIRWRGISQKEAIDITVNGDPDVPAEAEKQKLMRLLSHTEQLWLPFRKLRKIKPGEIPSMWYLGRTDRADYIFIDEKFAFVAEFQAGGARTYAIDAKEFDPQLKAKFARAAEQAGKAQTKNEHGEPKRLVPYWLDIQDRLRAEGVEWRSPADLQSGMAWH